MTAPQLWVPGELWVEPEEGRLVTGPLAGWWIDHEDIREWKDTHAYVAAAELGDARIPHPRTLLRDEHRHLRELLARTPLLEIPEAVPLEAVGDATVFTVGFARNADDAFAVTVTRGRDQLAHVGGASIDLEQAAGLDVEADEEVDLFDRILRAVSGGRLDGWSISLAGYWHALCASQTLLPVERELALREAMLGEVLAHAEPSRESARAIASRLRGADEEVPLYGTTRRTHRPALALAHAGDGELDAQVKIGGASSLALPAEDEWHVGAVEAWTPPSLAQLYDEQAVAMRARLERPPSRLKRWLFGR